MWVVNCWVSRNFSIKPKVKPKDVNYSTVTSIGELVYVSVLVDAVAVKV